MERPGATGTLSPPAGGRRRLLRAGVRLLASLTVLGVVLALVDLDAAWDGLRRLSGVAWLSALGAFLALHALAALKWRFVLDVTGARLGVRRALSCHAAGLFGNLCLPSLIGGDVLRIGLALPGTGARAALVLGSVVDRLIDLVALGSVAVVGLLLAPTAREALGGPLQALPVAGAALVACAGLSWLALRLLLRRRTLRRLPRRVARRIIDVGRAARAVGRSPARTAVAWAWSGAIQSGFVVTNLLLGRAVGLELEPALWFLLWPLAKIAAMLPVSFGGLGVREAAFASLVAPFAAASLAVVQSLVWQSVLVAGGLSCGVLWSVSKPAARAAPGT